MKINDESYSTSVLIKTPVRPDDDEDVAANGEKEDARHPGSMFGVDHVSNYLDHIEDQTDHSQNDPGHKQARFFLKQIYKKSLAKILLEPTFLAPWIRREATTT